MNKELVFLICSFTIVQFLVASQARDLTELKPRVVPPENISKFSFGYYETFADTLWLRAIQNLDYCRGNEKKYDGSDEPIQNIDLSKEDILGAISEAERTSKCRLGWVYQMLDRITDLSPRFNIVYLLGASTLSIVVDDDEGAARLYEKGLRVYPNDWRLAYRAAYHELFELHNFPKAANYLYIAGQNGAPLWVQNLAAKLYERSGQILLGRTVLQDLLKRVEGNPDLEKKARDRLRRLDELWTQELIRQRGKTQ